MLHLLSEVSPLIQGRGAVEALPCQFVGYMGMSTGAGVAGEVDALGPGFEVRQIEAVLRVSHGYTAGMGRGSYRLMVPEH